MSSLIGKRCIISGGSRGIGLAIARLFAAEGAACTLIGRNMESLTSAKASLEQKHDSQKHDTTPFDVSLVNGWEKLVANTKGENADILVNAAGISQNSFLFKASTPEIDELVATNLMSTIWSCKYIIPKMMKQRNGCIINVSSLLATHGGRGSSVYAASKAGIIGLTRALAWEVGRFGIRANVLLPGYIQTDMTKGMDNNGELSALIPMGRLGLADEVAEAALFLAKCSYAHNCVLNIDGGLSAT
ncbi:NAD(P)-binding protein [Annulohypoxylon maeteangense]|uniref:NAD(P)-binding protein n=1 Tax=Annulohypoxylon maeteangense TaxID=1927788 RepID=UPI00200800D7|nr:NAD(P)-binding protein [Annulohypoxylon maeteangense]KAI0884999.1 NAD(P)-binding protein [Annulohypoxylon maeteangense]